LLCSALMISLKNSKTMDSSSEEDVLVMENCPRSLQNKRHIATSGIAGKGKQIYCLIGSSQSEDEMTNDKREVCMEMDDKKQVLKEEEEDNLGEQTRHGQEADQNEGLEDGIKSETSSHFDLHRRHLDDDTSFFFRGHNISEGIKRVLAMCDTGDMGREVKVRRKHHNLDGDETKRTGIQVVAPSSVEHAPDADIKEGCQGNSMDESFASIKYDAAHDPEFAKLYAKFMTRGSMPTSTQAQHEHAKPVLELRSIKALASNSLNIKVHCQREGMVVTSLMACETTTSFGDISDALHHRFRKTFTLMYKKTPILSSLATPDALGMEEGSMIDAFDDGALMEFRSLQEREGMRQREWIEAERLASTSVHLQDTEDICENDQEGEVEGPSSQLWTLNVRVNAKQIESVEINPEDAVSRLLCLVLERLERPGASAVLVWDGSVLPADAIIRDADVEDGDQLELHFKQA
jgi:hypothetical protein